MKKICISSVVIVGIILLVLLLDNPLYHPNDVNDSTIYATGSSEYDVFSDPNVLWGSEDEFGLLTMGYPGGTVLFSPGLTELMSEANENNMVAFTARLIQACEFHTVDINCLAIPNSLVEDDYLLECIQLFNKADDLDSCAELYNKVTWYVLNTVSQNEFNSFCGSWKSSDIKWAHDRFIELGFIPVYGEEFTEQNQEAINKFLTFVGTTEDIRNLENKITTNEVYLLQTTSITEVLQKNSQ